jgi:hypothetical protein
MTRPRQHAIKFQRMILRPMPELANGSKLLLVLDRHLRAPSVMVPTGKVCSLAG